MGTSIHFGVMREGGHQVLLLIGQRWLAIDVEPFVDAADSTSRDCGGRGGGAGLKLMDLVVDLLQLSVEIPTYSSCCYQRGE